MPKFSCPHCGQHIDAGEEYAGAAATCPSCSNEIVVPVGEAEALQAEAAAPPEAEPEESYVESEDTYEAPPPLPAFAPPPPTIPEYHAPAQASFHGFAADMVKKNPRPGFAHYMLAFMALIVVLGAGWMIGFIMAQPEAGVKVEAHQQTMVANTFMIGFSLFIVFLSLVLSALTALIIWLFKKPFWRSFLTAFGLFMILISCGYGILFWNIRDAPGLKIFPVVPEKR